MFHKILVCLDGSKLAEQIIPYAVEQALHFSNQLVLLRITSGPFIVSPPIPGIPGVPVEIPMMEKKCQLEQDTATSYLETIASKLFEEKGLHAEYEAFPGVAGETIISYANDNGVELIAIATHGHGGLRRAVFGSVTDYVLRHSRIPMLIIIDL